jgi:hypothetical protein
MHTLYMDGNVYNKNIGGIHMKYVVMAMGCTNNEVHELYLAVPEAVFDTVEEANSYVESRFDNNEIVIDGYDDCWMHWYVTSEESPEMAAISGYDEKSHVCVAMMYVVELNV